MVSDEEFNFIRLGKCEKNAVLPALKETFKTVWDRENPALLWEWTEEHVKTFERKEEENFQSRIKGISKCEQKKTSYKHRQTKRYILGDPDKGDEKWKKWRSCDWDVGILVYVLVDSKLFRLDTISVTLSDCIVKLREVRNEMAHYTAFAVSITVFEQNMRHIVDSIRGLKCILDGHEKYLKIIEDIRKEKIPVSAKDVKKIKKEHELMMHACQLLKYELNANKARDESMEYERQLEDQKEQYESQIKELKSSHKFEIQELKRAKHLEQAINEPKSKSRECDLLPVGGKSSIHEREKQNFTVNEAEMHQELLVPQVEELVANKDAHPTEQQIMNEKCIKGLNKQQKKQQEVINEQKDFNLEIDQKYKEEINPFQKQLQEERKKRLTLLSKLKRQRSINRTQLQNHNATLKTSLASICSLQDKIDQRDKDIRRLQEENQRLSSETNTKTHSDSTYDSTDTEGCDNDIEQDTQGIKHLRQTVHFFLLPLLMCDFFLYRTEVESKEEEQVKKKKERKRKTRTQPSHTPSKRKRKKTHSDS